jgi:hypothetical protein
MKAVLLAAFTLGILATSTMAGPRFGFHVNVGGYGCSPRYVAQPVCLAPPVCHMPRVYCAPRVVYSQPTCYAPALVVPAPVPVYRAPIVTTSVTVGDRPFCWR